MGPTYVPRFINTVAFEGRCIRPGEVRAPQRTCPVRLGRDALPDTAHRSSRCDTVFVKRNIKERKFIFSLSSARLRGVNAVRPPEGLSITP